MTVENILNKYSNGGTPQYDFIKNEREFKKLQELNVSVQYPIEALFINIKGKFGNQGVIYTSDYIVNLPNHLTSLIEDMRSDSEVTEAINERKLAFEVYQYESEQGRKGYSINVVENNQDDTKGRAFDNSEDNLAF